MSDTNLDPSISALSTRATEVAASASARELLNLSRIAPSLEQSENAGLEVAINSRAAGLAPSATATELKSIGKAIGNVLEPDTFTAGAFIPAQLDQSGKFLGTSGTSKNWSGVTVSGLSEVNISAIANDETLVYNHVSSQFENSSQVFNIPQYAQTADLPASATSGATAFDASTAELKYWNGSEWKVAAVVATGGGAVGSGKLVIGAPFDDDNGDSSGSVYVYDAADLSAQPTKLIGELAGDRLGWSVALTSDKIIAGAQYHPMGPQTTTSRIGAVYAYDMNDLSAQPTKLVPSDVISSIGDNPYHSTEFGEVIVTSSDKIYIGHYRYPTEGVGAGSFASNVGAVFVYDANDLSADPIRIDNPETGQFWSDGLNQYLPRWESNEFGNSIAISSNYLVVGAHRYGKYTPNDATDTEASAGAVYVYDINNLSAAPTKLTVSDGAQYDSLGYAVAVSSDVIVASTVNDGGTGTNGDYSGSVYVWDANNLSASPTKLVAFDSTPNSYFGYDIVVSADKIFIATRAGAVYEYDVNNLSAAGTKHSPVAHTRYYPAMSIISDKILIGSKTDEGANYGMAHLYDLTDLSTPINTLTAFDGQALDQFGRAVAMSEGSSASSGSGSVVFSPAYQSEDTYSAGTHTFNVSGEYTITPSADVTATVKMWGAGGGGGYNHGGAGQGLNPRHGGPGGYSEMSLTLTSGQEYVIQIGEGGRGYNYDDNADQGATWQAGGGNDTFSQNQGASEGGGYTGLFLGNGGGDTTVSQGQAILIAGGGGGGGDEVYGGTFDGRGGAGGGLVGQSSVTGRFDTAHDMQGATGGTQSSAGSSSPYNGNNTGHAGPLRGGLSQSGYTGISSTITGGLGGGGGGYFGGGGGNVAGGGGGSGYVNDTYGTGSTTSIDASIALTHEGLPPNDDDSDYPTDAGRGGYGLGTTHRAAGVTTDQSYTHYNGYDGAVVFVIS